MSSLAAAMREHAPQYLRELERTDSNIQIRRVLEAIMKCRTGALGGVKWSCTQCGHTHWTGRSCGNRHCASCGSEKTQAWLDKQSRKLLVGVHHFMVTFTVPQELRAVLLANRRAGYEALMRASSSALIDVAASTKALKNTRLGFFGVLHTWGRDLMIFHPHVHYLVPGGGVTYDAGGVPDGWKSTPMNFLVHHGTLINVYKAKLADELRLCGLYDQVPTDAWSKNFVVDIEAVEDGRSVVAYLAPYVHRVAISDHRIKHVDVGSVTYEYVPSKTHSTVSRSVTGRQFVEGFTQHILPAGFRKIRYHGWMCSSSKTRLEEIRMLVWFALGWIYWMAAAYGSTAKPSHCPKPKCGRCKSEMQVQHIEFRPVRLELLNLFVPVLSSPARSPPIVDSS
jgi:hypothetical protein